MTEHDTTDYVATIKGAVAFLRTKTTAYQLDVIDRFTDALAAQLAAAEAERDAERARADSYKQGWDALGPFCTKQFRGDDPRITDEELHAFCVARRTIWDMEHGDLPTDGSDES